MIIEREAPLQSYWKLIEGLLFSKKDLQQVHRELHHNSENTEIKKNTCQFFRGSPQVSPAGHT